MRHDSWLTEISPDDIKAAMQRKAAREALIAEQAAEITRLRALVAETGALAARRAAKLEASEERERAIELRFWQIVDRDGLTGLQSDMWAALNQLVKDRAALATARRDAMEEAAKIADSCAADWSKSAKGKYLETKWDYESRADAGEEIAAAIRAAAGEVKP